MADLTLEIEIFIRIMSRSSLLSCMEISMERYFRGQILPWAGKLYSWNVVR